MKIVTFPTKGHQNQGNELITPEMHKEIVRIKNNWPFGTDP